MVWMTMCDDQVTPIKITVGKADYSRKINEKFSIETGVKVSATRLGNDVRLESLSQNDWTTDEALSAQYKLKEDIGAVYTVLNITVDEKMHVKTGLRYEYTSTNVSTLKVTDIVDRRYGNLFPSIFLSRKMGENGSINLSYNQRITRPTYNDIAPFVLFADPKIFFSGNPQLRPSISNTFKVGYTLKNYLLSVSYSYDKNPIARFQSKVDPANNRQYITAENFKNMKTVSTTLAIPVKIAQWWDVQNNIITAWQQVNTVYNTAPVQVDQVNYRITSSSSFTLPKDFSLELSGFYQSASFWGAALLKPMGSLNFGVQKKFKKGSLRFNVNDALNTIKYKHSVNIPEQNLVTTSHYLLNFRTFRLTYSRNFGNDNLKAKRTRATGSEEERRRAQ